MTQKYYDTHTPDGKFSYLIPADSSFQARQRASARTRGNVPYIEFMAIARDEVRVAPVPFAGFYNSTHDDNLQQALESLAQDEGGETIASELERLERNIQWRAAMLAYAQLYCERLADETSAQWEFAKLDSPREYNFRTDEIDVTVSLAELQRMLDAVDLAALQALATDRLSPHSGFIPFYSSQVDDWGALEDWDSPLLGLLIECYCDSMDQDREARDCWLVDDCNSDVTACIEAGLPAE
jgi:hypothetical protein